MSVSFLHDKTIKVLPFGNQIKNLTSVLTIVGGRVVYGSDKFDALAPKIADPLPSWSPVKYFGGYHFEK